MNATNTTVDLKKRILIVDDEQDFTFLMGLTLEQTGRYETRQENDAMKSVASARSFGPDLILLDVMMPDLDGGDVLSQLRADPITRDIPVIFLTALVVAGDSAAAGGLPSGGNCFLPKPVHLPSLIQRIEELTGGGADEPRPEAE